MNAHRTRWDALIASLVFAAISLGWFATNIGWWPAWLTGWGLNLPLVLPIVLILAGVVGLIASIRYSTRAATPATAPVAAPSVEDTTTVVLDSPDDHAPTTVLPGEHHD